MLLAGTVDEHHYVHTIRHEADDALVGGFHVGPGRVDQRRGGMLERPDTDRGYGSATAWCGYGAPSLDQQMSWRPGISQAEYPVPGIVVRRVSAGNSPMLSTLGGPACS
jgi:hypothetical protein